MKEKKEAEYLGYCQHDDEAHFRCPECGKSFGSWLVFHNKPNENGTEEYCPHCGVELDGLG